MGTRLLLALAVVLACGLSIARAEGKPWASGIGKDQQKQALALYTEGNGYFEQDLYAEALKRFEAAITVWDHPAIRYNAALSSMHLDRIEEAFEHLTRALRFGAAPFTPELHKEAVTYEKLLGNQLGEIDVRTSQPTAITLDGKPLLDGPGSITRLVRVGAHQLVATRSGFLTDTRTLEVRPRAKDVVEIMLKRPVVARKLQRRWSRWKPIAVLVGGGVVAAIGVPLDLEAQRRFVHYDDEVQKHWDDPETPPQAAIPSEIATLHDDATLMRTATISAFAVGGVLIVTGAAMLVMNQPRLAGPTTTISRQLGSDRAGVVISGRW